MEKIADLKSQAAAAAAAKIEEVEKKVSFIDFSKIKEGISDHPRSARLSVAIAKRTELDKILLPEVQRMADAQGIKLLDAGGGRIRPRAAEHHKFLEILDDRRYISKITGSDIAFVARSRIRATAE